MKLPKNVHFFPVGQVESLPVQGDAGPLARLIGASCDGQRPLRLNDFTADTTSCGSRSWDGTSWDGTSCDGNRTAAALRETRDGSATAVPTQLGGLYTIAVVHGQPDLAALQNRGINYWALGGRHDRSTPQSGAQFVHYCGTTQGRRPEESGIHGCTLVEVDGQRQTRTSLIPTDVALDERAGSD